MQEHVRQHVAGVITPKSKSCSHDTVSHIKSTCIRICGGEHNIYEGGLDLSEFGTSPLSRHDMLAAATWHEARIH